MNASLIRVPLVAAGLCVAFSAHAVTFFDDFSTSQPTVTNSSANGGVVGSTFALTPTIGRLLTIQNNSNLAPGDARSRLAITGGFLSVGNDPEVNSTQTLQYYFSTPQNFTGLNALSINFLSNDIAGMVQVFVDDASPKNVSHGAALPVSASPFSLTVNDIFGGDDATRITSIALVFTGTSPGQDLRVKTIQAVPEPSALAALGVGALAFLKRRKRA